MRQKWEAAYGVPSGICSFDLAVDDGLGESSLANMTLLVANCAHRAMRREVRDNSNTAWLLRALLWQMLARDADASSHSPPRPQMLISRSTDLEILIGPWKRLRSTAAEILEPSS
jgi:hypothetical protein